MDSIVKVRRSFLNEIRALLRAFRSVCDSCYKRPCNCYFSDELTRAESMIKRIDCVRDAEEEMFYVANPAEEYMATIVKAIEQGGGRVKSQCISPGNGGRQKKARALKALVKRGRIIRETIDGSTFYSLTDKQTNNKERKPTWHST